MFHPRRDDGRPGDRRTHEMAFAREAADRVYFIEDGMLAEVGPPDQVLNAPRDERTRRFLARFTAGDHAGTTVGA